MRTLTSFSILFLLAGCGDSHVCAPGSTAACVCPDGRAGAQVCADDGTRYEACVCAGDDGGMTDGGGELDAGRDAPELDVPEPMDVPSPADAPDVATADVAADTAGPPWPARWVSAGENHSCAALLDGSVACWGSNSDGQLGNGMMGVDSPTPVFAVGATDVVQVVAGRQHTLALRSDGSVLCWGISNGLCGPEDVERPYETTPVVVPDVVGARALSMYGGSRPCALLADGSVICWAPGGGMPRTPMTVSGIMRPVDLDTGGGGTTCAVLSRTTRCWGYAGDGVLGDGTAAGVDTGLSTVLVSGLTDAIDIDVSINHACAVRAGGGVACWGRGGGRLGQPDTADHFTPVNVPGVTDAVSVAANVSDTCVVRRDGTRMCWGGNSAFGDGTTEPSLTAAVPIADPAPIRMLSGGFNHFCAIVGDAVTGGVYCWGANDHGEVGTVGASLVLSPSRIEL